MTAKKQLGDSRQHDGDHIVAGTIVLDSFYGWVEILVKNHKNPMFLVNLNMDFIFARSRNLQNCSSSLIRNVGGLSK